MTLALPTKQAAESNQGNISLQQRGTTSKLSSPTRSGHVDAVEFGLVFQAAWCVQRVENQTRADITSPYRKFSSSTKNSSVIFCFVLLGACVWALGPRRMSESRRSVAPPEAGCCSRQHDNLNLVRYDTNASETCDGSVQHSRQQCRTACTCTGSKDAYNGWYHMQIVKSYSAVPYLTMIVPYQLLLCIVRSKIAIAFRMILIFLYEYNSSILLQIQQVQ